MASDDLSCLFILSPLCSLSFLCPFTSQGPFEDRIYQINKKMQSIYNQKDLSDNDKIQLVALMEDMDRFCEPQDHKIVATKYEQEDFVNGLTENENRQLDEQLQMFKDCRNLYPKFSNRFKY